MRTPTSLSSTETNYSEEKINKTNYYQLTEAMTPPLRLQTEKRVGEYEVIEITKL